MKQKGINIRQRKPRKPWWENANDPVVRDRIDRLRMKNGLPPLRKPEQRKSD